MNNHYRKNHNKLFLCSFHAVALRFGILLKRKLVYDTDVNAMHIAVSVANTIPSTCVDIPTVGNMWWNIGDMIYIANASLLK